MPLLIDGHNLVGQMADLSLENPDDVIRLIERLRRFHARTGKPVTVIFDQGLPGGRSRDLSTPGVQVIFAPADADSLILRRVRECPNPADLTVVSSDGELRRAARLMGAHTLTAGEFARRLATPGGAPGAGEPVEAELSPQEVAEWLRLFGQDLD